MKKLERKKIKMPGLWEQVCHVDYSKRLRELGINEPSLFYYLKKKDEECHNGELIKHCWGIMYIHEYAILSEEDGFKMENYEIYNAYTSSELDALLPESIPDEGDLIIWNTRDDNKRMWGIEYCGMDQPDFIDENSANALAMILIYLLENNLCLGKNRFLKSWNQVL